MAQISRSGGESVGSSSNSELSDSSERLRQGTWMKRGAFSALALALTATGAFFVVHSSSNLNSSSGSFGMVQNSGSGSFGFVDEQQNNSGTTGAGTTTGSTGTTVFSGPDPPCANYERVDLKSVTYNNLGGQGPDKGAEGMVYEGLAFKKNGSSFPVTMMVNATGEYKPNNASENGLNGTIGYINVNSRNSGKPATAVLKFTFWSDAKAGVPFPVSSVTFVDLDALSMMDSVEYVKMRGFHSFVLSNATQIKPTGPDAMGAYTFSGSMPGSGVDNPTDPMYLTTLQLAKSVTLTFSSGTVGFETEIGCSAGNSVRQIGFVIRPSITCYNVSGNTGQSGYTWQNP